MHPLQKYLIKYGMQGMLYFLAFFARRKPLKTISDNLTSSLADYVANQKQLQTAHSLEELGKSWQDAFAAKKLIPITVIDENTVYAEIRINCPLKGTGDTLACYNMMNFDRKILEKVGGQFVVLESQATPGVNYCKVAMRMQGASTADLIPAHQKTDL